MSAESGDAETTQPGMTTETDITPLA